MIKTTIIGGALFLLPLIIIVAVLGKAFELSLTLARPIDAIIPIETVGGVALANVIAIGFILGVCYLAGVISRNSAVKSRINTLDGLLIQMLPPYAFAKTMLSSFAQAEDAAGTLTPVLVTFDDHAQICLEVERADGLVTIYQPGSPSPWSGNTVVVGEERVRSLDLNANEAIKVIRLLGRGGVGHAAKASGEPAVGQAV
ncbi:MAG: hypothetical protein AAGD13_05790 [Pseudomonadota bacterium]